MKRFAVVALVIAVTVGLFGSLAIATPQTQYPAPGTWMADCPTAPRANYIAYHWMPGATPSQRAWCTLVNDGMTSQVWVVDPPLEGIGASTAFLPGNWDGSALHNEVVISALQTPTEEQAHLQALYDLIDARIALQPGTGPTGAEWDAMVITVGALQSDIVTLQTDLSTVQTGLTIALADITTMQIQIVALEALTILHEAKQTNIYDSLKAFYAAFDPTQ
jgi:hypothetical protein